MTIAERMVTCTRVIVLLNRGRKNGTVRACGGQIEYPTVFSDLQEAVVIRDIDAPI